MAKLFAQGNSLLSQDVRTSLTCPEPQKMVKDEVVFAPARNPYAALERASQRLSEGRSLLEESRPVPLADEN